MKQKIERYFDLLEEGVDIKIREYLANGWYITHRGLTLMILEKEIDR